MKKIITTGLMLATCIFIMESFGGAGDPKYSSGSPGGYSGSPGDGHDCTQCHSGTVTPVTTVITSNIPVSGYTPGNNYTFTITLTGSSANKKGFEVSPQTLTGALVGSLTTGTGTKLVNSNKAVTQNSSVTSNPATWSFTWTAPAAGTGNVNFYGCFVVGTTTTTNTLTSSIYVAQEATGIGIEENILMNTKIYPNPANKNVNFCCSLLKTENLRIKLFTSGGRFITCLMDELSCSGNHVFKLSLPDNLSKGVYLMEISAGGQKITRKIVVQ